MTIERSTAIRTRQLAKRYQSGTANLIVFENLDLEVPAGQRLALVGESGAGKSTLLHLIGGLDRPSEGRIECEGVDITTLDEAGLAEFRNRQIGFVWQTHYLLPEFTALENVMMPLLIRGVRQMEAQRAARERLEEVGLGARMHHRSGELSGGEQQRVVIARALVARPRVLLADEPTGNLDYRTGDRIADLFDALHHSHGLTSVFVTHNIGFARRCDRILKLEHGKLMTLDEDPAPVPAGHSGLRSSESGAAGLADLQRKPRRDDTASKEDGTNHV